MVQLALISSLVVAIVPSAYADLDAVDFVGADWVLKQASLSAKQRSLTQDAQDAIVSSAKMWGSKKSIIVANDNGVLPPSGDSRDYLSWAPYHWPDCNWCKKGQSHLAHNGDEPFNNGTDSSPSSDLDNDDVDIESLNSADSSLANGDNAQANFALPAIPSHQRRRMHRRRFRRELLSGSSSTIIAPTATSQDVGASAAAIETPSPPMEPPLVPTQDLDSPDIGLTTTTRTSRPTGTNTPSRHAAKTQKEKCTPSPSRSMPPSATWTTCKYIVRDGKVNPDVRTLKGVGAIQHVAEAIHHNSIAYGLEHSSKFSKDSVRFIKAFFLDAETGMNPNVNFGQIVRGPGPKGQQGTFTGILDLRGMVKIIDGVSIMRASNSPDWTEDVENSMTDWMNQYAGWLTNSDIGKQTASRGNNHGSFYFAQAAAAKLYAGDSDGAAEILQKFFDGPFKDQIAKSGEQPFEASRTRPYHYRAFNLEALIVNAKLGDQVGKNFWTAESKYGANIQKAVDYAMKQPVKKEDPTDMVPHVAAVAAAYGDPLGKYSAFIQKYDPKYERQPYWFYDQPGAVEGADGKKKRRSASAESDGQQMAGSDEPSKDVVPFECPAVFKKLDSLVELDNGIYVSCEQLRKFYEDT